jgi:mono/diheme cytochrome c family protein
MNKSKLIKGAGIAAGVILIIGGGAAGTSVMRSDRTFDVPEVPLAATADSAIIERGAYLVYGPAHCAYCHTTKDEIPQLEAGERVPLSGGNTFAIGIATLHTPNLTPDRETGIGDVADGKLARMLRHNVMRDGRAAIPFMEFQNLSDQDVVAIMSYLRSQPAVKNAVPPRELHGAGYAIMSFVIKPTGPTGTPPAQSPPEGATVERGAYLVNSVSACAGCHTKRSMKDGSYLAPKLSGGMEMEGEGDSGKMYITPNLTPDAATGHIAKWSEDQFVQRFRAGPINGADSPMPWRAFGRMSDDDLRAIYRYLKTVPPTQNVTGPLVTEAAPS